MSWEYLTSKLNLQNTLAFFEGDEERTMSYSEGMAYLGANGWELVCSAGYGNSNDLLLFKREKEA